MESGFPSFSIQHSAFIYMSSVVFHKKAGSKYRQYYEDN